MNEDILKGAWLEIKGGVKEKWGKLTANEFIEIEGKGEKLLGRLRKRYGYINEKADLEYNDTVELAKIVSRIHEIMKKRKLLWQLPLLPDTGSLCYLRTKRVQ